MRRAPYAVPRDGSPRSRAAWLAGLPGSSGPPSVGRRHAGGGPLAAPARDMTWRRRPIPRDLGLPQSAGSHAQKRQRRPPRERSGRHPFWTEALLLLAGLALRALLGSALGGLLLGCLAAAALAGLLLRGHGVASCMCPTGSGDLLEMKTPVAIPAGVGRRRESRRTIPPANAAHTLLPDARTRRSRARSACPPSSAGALPGVRGASSGPVATIPPA